MSDWDRGWEAFWESAPFTDTEPLEWRNGWVAARDYYDEIFRRTGCDD